MVFAQLERETITQRITDSYRFRSKDGVFMGGNITIGYTHKRISIDGKSVPILEIDDSKSSIVCKIYDMYLTGYNSHQIAHRLNESGILTNVSSFWTRKKVIRVLENITYAENSIEIYYFLKSKGYTIQNPIDDFDGEHGMLCFFKNRDKNKSTNISDQLVCIGMHAPIISSSKWIAVQNKIEASKSTEKQPKRSLKNWAAGMIKCAECGYSFGLRSTGRGTRKYDYYRCSYRAMSGETACNNSKWIPAHELESIVESRLKSHAKRLLNNYTPKQKKNDSRSIEVHKQIDLFQQQLNNLIDNIGKGNAVTDKYITERITELDKKIGGLQSELNVEVNQNDSKIMVESVCKKINGGFSSMTVEEKNKSAKMLVDKIVVDKEGNIKIHWKI